MEQEEFKRKHPDLKLLCLESSEGGWLADVRDSNGKFVAACVRPTLAEALKKVDMACFQRKGRAGSAGGIGGRKWISLEDLLEDYEDDDEDGESNES